MNEDEINTLETNLCYITRVIDSKKYLIAAKD